MLSNVALIANMLILPFVPLAMLLVFLVGVCSGAPFVADILAVPTTWLLKYMTSVAQWLADQPWAQSEIAISGVTALVAYVGLALAIWWMARQTKFRFGEVNIVE